MPGWSQDHAMGAGAQAYRSRDEAINVRKHGIGKQRRMRTDSVRVFGMDWVRVIAGLQILGGLHGLAQLIGLMSTSEKMQYSGTVSYLIFTMLLVLSVVSGILLWFKKRRGFVWSILIQFLQAIRITFGAINYGFHTLISLGVYIRFRKGNSGFGIDFEFLDTYFYAYTKMVYKFNLYLPFEVVINVSALLCFFYLYFIFDRSFPMATSQGIQEPTERAFTDR